MEKEENDTCIADLTKTFESIYFLLQRKNLSRTFFRQEWLYIALFEGSQSTRDVNGHILAGNPDWTLSSKHEVALHFAEFHSDENNRKRTALISATNDPLRAVKRAYWKRCETKSLDKIFIYVVQSSNFFWAQELRELIKEPHLRSRLSLESYERLMSPRNESIHETEAVFLHKIPCECIKIRVSLHELLNRGLLEIISALEKRHPMSSKYLSPKGIREDIIASNVNDIPRMAVVYKRLFCIIAQEGELISHGSLKTAQGLLLAYQLIGDEVKTHCAELFDASLPSARRLVIRRAPKFADDED